MGSRMAPLVNARYPTTACDRDPRRLAEMAAAGLRTTDDLLAVAGSADVVILLLPDSRAVEATVTPQLLDALPTGATIIDMGSSRPESTRALAELAAAHGVGYVDAPVSGGVRKAQDGTLTVMVGGDPETIDKVMPIIEIMAGSVFRMGPAGSGHAMKALNNLLSAITIAGTTEVLRVGTAMGLDPHVMLDVINVSTGANHASQMKFRQFVLSGTFKSGFSLHLMVKDLLTATELAHSVAEPVPVSASTLEAWIEAKGKLPAGADHTAFATALYADGTPPSEAES